MQQVFFDDILSRQHDDWMFTLLLAMGVVAILQASLTYLRSWCLTRWQGSMTVGGSSKFIWHLFHLPMEFFQQRYVGELASRAQFNESVAQVLTVRQPPRFSMLQSPCFIYYCCFSTTSH